MSEPIEPHLPFDIEKFEQLNRQLTPGRLVRFCMSAIASLAESPNDTRRELHSLSQESLIALTMTMGQLAARTARNSERPELRAERIAGRAGAGREIEFAPSLQPDRTKKFLRGVLDDEDIVGLETMDTDQLSVAVERVIETFTTQHHQRGEPLTEEQTAQYAARARDFFYAPRIMDAAAKHGIRQSGMTMFMRTVKSTVVDAGFTLRDPSPEADDPNGQEGA